MANRVRSDRTPSRRDAARMAPSAAPVWAALSSECSKGDPMRGRKALLFLLPVVVVLLSLPAGRSNAGGVRFAHGQFGKPLEGLTMQQRALFRDGKAAFEQADDV